MTISKILFASSLLVAIVVSGGIGFTAGAIAADEHSDHEDHSSHDHSDHSEKDHDDHDDHSHGDNHSHSDEESHSHEKYEVGEDEIQPSLSNLTVVADPKSGWNVSFETENFTFSPENASTEHIPGEGHGHLYLNDTMLGRLYGTDVHIPKQDKDGEYIVRVTLNTNVHDEYSVDGKVVSQEVTVTQNN